MIFFFVAGCCYLLAEHTESRKMETERLYDNGLVQVPQLDHGVLGVGEDLIFGRADFDVDDASLVTAQNGRGSEPEIWYHIFMVGMIGQQILRCYLSCRIILSSLII